VNAFGLPSQGLLALYESENDTHHDENGSADGMNS